VRGEIELLEGRLRTLSDLAALTTVTVRITEIEKYTPQESPTYWTKVRRVWSESIRNLVVAAQGLSLVAVALCPWLLVLLVPVAIVLLLVRLAGRRGQGQTAGQATPSEKSPPE